MFNCQLCHETGTKPKRVVTKTQVVNHRANRVNKKTKEVRSVVVGRGPQIREELTVCEPCSQKVVVSEMAPEPEETVTPPEQDDRTDYTAIVEQFDEEEVA